MGTENYVARCPLCGTAYTARSWYWLESLGIERYGEGGAAALELRQCAVPGCCNTLARASAISVAMSRTSGQAANDVE